MKAFTLLVVLFSVLIANAQKSSLKDYTINWDTPGLNSQGSMPLGNGDIGVNAWVEQNGDLVFYLSKTDAWSENGRLLKLGKIRVSITPDPYNKKSFSQELKIEEGEILVNYGKTTIRLWVDANHPTVQVDINSKTPVNAQVSYESWRKTSHEIKGEEALSIWGYGERSGCDKKEQVLQEPDVLLSNCKNQIAWYHHNTYSIWKGNLELEALGDFAKNSQDPLLNRTYGAMIESEAFINKSDTLLISKDASTHFQINIYPLTLQSDVDSWKNQVLKNAGEIRKIPSETRENAHLAWWKQFWDRNYIFITSNDKASSKEAETVTQGYILQRFINACGGRGNSPVKFNGSIFTVDTYNRKDEKKGLDADFRAWGGCYWFQNTRLPYWSMLVSGDFDMMKSLFGMYLNALPLRKSATQIYYKHEGAFYPETMNFWGTYSNGDYGCDRKDFADGYTQNPYIRYYWSGGLELSMMMLDYYSFTGSTSFAIDTLVPLASEILTFYDQHWKRDSTGEILFSPAMSLETFHTAVNPLPEIVGIRSVAERMLALPEALTTETRRLQWKKLIDDLPAIPLRVVDNDTVIAPAAVFSSKANVENPELYSIFPYRTYGFGKPDIELAKRTFAIRNHKDNGGWQQNSIQAAYLGLTEDARQMVVESFSNWDKNFRFPAFWGPNYDWTPDQDHGNVAMIALQRMLIQYENNTIIMMPAWPKEWDVRFKLNAPHNTSIEGVYKHGIMMEIKTIPENRINDVKILYSQQ
jgi:alpha-L-fucosidase 2